MKNKDDVRFTYIRDPKNSKRVVTIARRMIPHRTHVEYSLAICSPKDVFKKKMGRQIALGRLNTVRVNPETQELEPASRKVIIGNRTPVEAIMFDIATNAIGHLQNIAKSRLDFLRSN